MILKSNVIYHWNLVEGLIWVVLKPEVAPMPGV